jgi:formylglycine-generating enzyme required for sulfatase activity
MASTLKGRSTNMCATAKHVSSGKRLEFWTIVLLISALTVWRITLPSTVTAQAKTKVNPKDGATYVWIEPATFQMGCSQDDSACGPDEKPAHSVTISKGFWIGQTLVTQGTYKKVVTANPNIYRGDQISEPVEQAGLNPSIFKGDRLPVEGMTWNDANAFCEGVGMRLPTEAEWEYAARGSSTASTYAALDQIGWWDGNSDGSTHEVSQKQANAYGLYDMIGDVWEWVSDWYAPYEAAAATDPKGPAHGTYHVLRGGSWYTGGRLSASTRMRGQAWVGGGNFGGDRGLRCVGD